MRPQGSPTFAQDSQHVRSLQKQTQGPWWLPEHCLLLEYFPRSMPSPRTLSLNSSYFEQWLLLLNMNISDLLLLIQNKYVFSYKSHVKYISYHELNAFYIK